MLLPDFGTWETTTLIRPKSKHARSAKLPTPKLSHTRGSPPNLSSPPHPTALGIQLHSKGLLGSANLRTISALRIYSNREWSLPTRRITLSPRAMRPMRHAVSFWSLTPLLPHFCGDLQRSQRPGPSPTSHLSETKRISTQNMGGGVPPGDADQPHVNS
jgi:hypothetical protein